MKYILIAIAMMALLSLSLTGCVTGEARGGAVAECADRMDNDGDGYCDAYSTKLKCKDGSRPGDPDCSDTKDNKEASDCIPVTETCDGLDNDCDGVADDGLTIACVSDADCPEDGFYGQYYCSEDGKVMQTWTDHYCESAGTCDSACVQETAEQLIEACEQGCIDGACTQPAPCTDSDGGSDYYTAGEVTTVTFNTSVWKDKCTGLNLIEYSCDGDMLGYESYFCPGGCIEGRCLPVLNCTDTDHGYDIYVKGKVEYWNVSETVEHWDWCYQNATLYEFECNGAYPDMHTVECPKNTSYPYFATCLDGRCLW